MNTNRFEQLIEKLLAPYPELPLDRKKAGNTINFTIIPSLAKRLTETLDELPAEATLRDLLSKLQTELLRQVFLEVYIELVINGKDHPTEYINGSQQTVTGIIHDEYGNIDIDTMD